MLKVENLLIASFGIITVTLFIIILLVGGLFDSIHASLFREVSFFISPYARTQAFTIPLFQVYNYYLILFAHVLGFRMQSIYSKLGSLYLIATGIIGLILVQHPMDPRGIANSVAGVTHIIILLFMTLYTTAALILLSYAFKKMRHLAWLANYTATTSFILLFASLFVGIFAFLSMSNYVGFIERLPIGVFLIWILITAIAMLHSDSRIKHYIWH